MSTPALNFRTRPHSTKASSPLVKTTDLRPSLRLNIGGEFRTNAIGPRSFSINSTYRATCPAISCGPWRHRTVRDSGFPSLSMYLTMTADTPLNALAGDVPRPNAFGGAWMRAALSPPRTRAVSEVSLCATTSSPRQHRLQKQGHTRARRTLGPTRSLGQSTQSPLWRQLLAKAQSPFRLDRFSSCRHIVLDVFAANNPSAVDRDGS